MAGFDVITEDHLKSQTGETDAEPPINYLEVGYGHFFPGEFIRQSGQHRPEDFAYRSFQYTF